MESALTWEYKTLINELTQGREKAKQLRFHLCCTSPPEAQNLLLQSILSSYEKALLILKSSGSKERNETSGATLVTLESSVSVDGSHGIDQANKNYREHQDHKNTSKKRKMPTTWMEQVKINSENGLEGPTDDRYSWRKYGQKDILGAKYPRSYYRCTYRLVQDCWATKQVQRSDEDPTIFDIIYKGTHTCNHSTNAVPPPASPEKQELKHNNSSHHNETQILSNFKANLRVNTENLGNEDMATHFSFPSAFACHDGENYNYPISAHNGNYQSSYSQLFLSPAASESDFFSATAYPMKSSWEPEINLQHLEADIAEIVSADPSASNSPIGDMEFPIDHLFLDPNFPFHNTEFFTYSNIEC